MALRGRLGAHWCVAMMALLIAAGLMPAEMRHLVVDDYEHARDVSEQAQRVRFHPVQIQQFQASNRSMTLPVEGFDARSEALTQQLVDLDSTADSHFASIASPLEQRLSISRYGLGLFAALILAGVLFALWRLYRSLFVILGGEPVVAATAARRIAASDMDVSLHLVPGGTQSVMAGIAATVATLKQFHGTQRSMVPQHALGMMDYRADTRAFPSVYREIVEESNHFLGGHIGVIQRVVELIQPYAAADFSERKAPLPGQKARVSDSICDNLSQTATQAAENTWTRAALDNIASNVRIADGEGWVAYAIKALWGNLRVLESAIRRRISDFSANKFVGMDISRFYDNPERLRQVIRTLDRMRNTQGDASIRVDAGDKRGFMLQVAQADGDISRRVATGYAGVFGSLKEAANTIQQNAAADEWEVF